MRKITVSVCFVKEWWDEYFHPGFARPDKASDDALDAMYLARKKFLFEKFGEFGVGEKRPAMDGRYVNLIIKYGMDLIPYLLGAGLSCQATGGYMPTEFSYEQLARMEPVDIANNPMGEWVLAEKERKLARYGTADVFLDYESPLNIAARLRGIEFYIDLVADPGFARHVLEISAESGKSVLAFQRKHFRPSPYPVIYDYQISDCSVTMISPEMYADIIRPFDIDFALLCDKISGGASNLLLHACDIVADKYLEAYSRIPSVARLQASYRTDIEKVAREMPGVSFCAMVSPGELNEPGPVLAEKIFDRTIRLGSVELDLWSIDTRTSPEQVKEIMSAITGKCAEYGAEPVFDVIPFVWDELEWAYPVYQHEICRSQ